MPHGSTKFNVEFAKFAKETVVFAKNGRSRIKDFDKHDKQLCATVLYTYEKCACVGVGMHVRLSMHTMLSDSFH